MTLIITISYGFWSAFRNQALTEQINYFPLLKQWMSDMGGSLDFFSQENIYLVGCMRTSLYPCNWGRFLFFLLDVLFVNNIFFSEVSWFNVMSSQILLCQCLCTSSELISWICSAFMIGDGKLLTNAHCVDHDTQVLVKFRMHGITCLL